ncbi:MAG: flavodoxin family protein [Methanoregula sp.]|jgi:putative NADPH-quinone reductase
MERRIIGVLGSPLENGNTARLFARAVRGAEDAGCTVEVIKVTSIDFEACQEMFFCREHETCIIDDAMQEVYGKFREMDSLILATPVMTMGIPGKLKSFMDRFQVFFMAKYIRNESLVPLEKRKARQGLFIGTAGMEIPEVFTGAKLTVRAFFDIIDCAYRDELLVNGMDAILDISTRPDLLDAAYRKGYALGSGSSPSPGLQQLS